MSLDAAVSSGRSASPVEGGTDRPARLEPVRARAPLRRVRHRGPPVPLPWPGVPGSVQRLPNGSPGDDGIPPADLYRSAVEEYRFQTMFNWSRTQYLLAFNAGLLTAAVVTSQWSGVAAVAIYAFGVLAAGLSITVVRTQHDYYRAARDRMRRVEAMYNVPAAARVDTTATLGNRPGRSRVNLLVQVLLVGMIAANLVGAIIALA